MSSRDLIVSKIKTNKPDFIEAPVITLELFVDWRPVEKEFVKKVETAGGTVFEATSNEEVIKQVANMFSEAKVNFSTLKNTESFNTVDFKSIIKPLKIWKI